MEDERSQFQVIVRLDTLLGDGQSDTLAVSTLELTSEQVTEPALEQGDDTAQEE
jgi:hypothetical protein